MGTYWWVITKRKREAFELAREERKARSRSFLRHEPCHPFSPPTIRKVTKCVHEWFKNIHSSFSRALRGKEEMRKRMFQTKEACKGRGKNDASKTYLGTPLRVRVVFERCVGWLCSNEVDTQGLHGRETKDVEARSSIEESTIPSDPKGRDATGTNAFARRVRRTPTSHTSHAHVPPRAPSPPIFPCAVEDPVSSMVHSSAGFGAVPHLPSDVLFVSHDLPVRLAYPRWSKWKLADRALVIFDVIT